MKPTELTDDHREEIDFFIAKCGVLGLGGTPTQIIARYLMMTVEQRANARNALATLLDINFARSLTEAEEANLIVAGHDPA